MYLKANIQQKIKIMKNKVLNSSNQNNSNLNMNMKKKRVMRMGMGKVN